MPKNTDSCPSPRKSRRTVHPPTPATNYGAGITISSILRKLRSRRKEIEGRCESDGNSGFTDGQIAENTFMLTWVKGMTDRNSRPGGTGER